MRRYRIRIYTNTYIVQTGMSYSSRMHGILGYALQTDRYTHTHTRMSTHTNDTNTNVIRVAVIYCLMIPNVLTRLQERALLCFNHQLTHTAAWNALVLVSKYYTPAMAASLTWEHKHINNLYYIPHDSLSTLFFYRLRIMCACVCKCLIAKNVVVYIDVCVCACMFCS